jgi:AbrB family looped-hinge helix DNA binding protein
MEEVELRVDSKGRIRIPAEIRNRFGDLVVLRKTAEGYLLVPFLDDFKKVVSSKPRRTGKPEFWSPEQMKSIWESKV